MILDYFDLNFLQDAARLVDGRLKILDREAKSSPDPDSFGIYDEIEYITGFGFVACQTYITATIGRRKIKRRDALEFGPKRRTGDPIVALVNACANYWKHSAEWSRRKMSLQAKETLKSTSSLGVNTSCSYPITNALYEILTPSPTRFASALPFLTQWRDTLPSRAAE